VIGQRLEALVAWMREVSPQPFNARAYVDARVSTKATQSTRPGDQPESCATDKTTCNFGGTYPYVGAGNVIQNRYFLETKLRHDVLPPR